MHLDPLFSVKYSHSESRRRREVEKGRVDMPSTERSEGSYEGITYPVFLLLSLASLSGESNQQQMLS